MADQDPNQPSAQPPPPPPAQSPTPPSQPVAAQDAGTLADAALSAAQQAVSSLKGNLSPESPPPPGADDRAAAALAAAQAAIADVRQASGGPAAFVPPAFAAGAGREEAKGIDLLADVTLNVKIELGRTRMLIEDVLRLSEGAVVELDKLAGDPVDVYVNDRPIARGEVLVLNDNFCVRINEILAHNIEEEHVRPTPHGGRGVGGAPAGAM
jgi:flagellar motor switch protein FliN/FliY